MADEAHTIRSINWRDVFPFTHIFRAFRIAVHPSKLLLALAALLLIYLGGRLLDSVWMGRYLVQPGEPLYLPAADVAAGQPRGIFISFFEFEVGQIMPIFNTLLALNWYGAFERIWLFMLEGPRLLFKYHPLYAVLFTAWFLLVWSVFGGAVSRIAAVHVARDEKISVRQALRFSISKVLSFLFAPLIPLLIILVIGVIVSATGWALLHIPVVGPILTGLLFFLALLAGFIMTLVALGTIGGFNLMFPTVAVEGSDSFDAISRSFSYVFARPWRMLWYTLVALVYGGIAYLFVRFFIFVMLALTHFFVGWWLTGQTGRHWKGPASVTEPPSVLWPAPRWESLTYNVDYPHLSPSEDIAAGAISFWVYLTIGLLGAFAISFYFSANTIIYYLMRREVDATELDDVYVEETEDEFGEPAPVAGTDAGDRPALATTVGAGPTTSAPGAGEVAEGAAGGARAYGGPEGETRPSPSGGAGSEP